MTEKKIVAVVGGERPGVRRVADNGPYKPPLLFRWWPALHRAYLAVRFGENARVPVGERVVAVLKREDD